MNKIHELAKLMIAEGFIGQGMRNEEKAADFIYMAADNPDVENELPETGFRFWRFAEFYFKRWKARKKFGDNDRREVEIDDETWKLAQQLSGLNDPTLFLLYILNEAMRRQQSTSR